ncbi:MAG: P-loop NTPase [Desulfobacterales bacterium]
MKILVCGKGGSGKSTLSVMLARAFADMERRVLLVDADESNFGIPHLIGVDAPCDLMESFGGKKGFKEKMNAKFPDSEEGVFDKKQGISDLAPECVAVADGIHVVTIGKIHHFGEGCACPMGILSRKFLSSLTVGENEVVIVDTEAGVEHFGRRVISEADVILGVVDPTAESLRLAEKMAEMAADAQKKIYFVLNKTEHEIESYMTAALPRELVAAKIPKDNEMFMASLQGKPIKKAGKEVSELAAGLFHAK